MQNKCDNCGNIFQTVDSTHASSDPVLCEKCKRIRDTIVTMTEDCTACKSKLKQEIREALEGMLNRIECDDNRIVASNDWKDFWKGKV